MGVNSSLDCLLLFGTSLGTPKWFNEASVLSDCVLTRTHWAHTENKAQAINSVWGGGGGVTVNVIAEHGQREMSLSKHGVWGSVLLKGSISKLLQSNRSHGQSLCDRCGCSQHVLGRSAVQRAKIPPERSEALLHSKPEAPHYSRIAGSGNFSNCMLEITQWVLNVVKK